ncbi:MAG: Cationic 19 kDa outer membrane protein [Bacteroidota bacterium]|jgi:outer membrane protein
MKNIALIFLIAFTSITQAQRFAFVDTEKIMEQIPAYKAAQEQLDKLAEDYLKEIETLKKDLNNLLYTYQADKILLTDAMKIKREEEIEKKKSDLDKLKQQHFGENGNLFAERQKLVKPIQDKVYDAIKDVAEKGNFNLILDLASNLSIMYYDEKYDKTKDVLKKLGY